MPNKILAYAKAHKIKSLVILAVVVALGWYWYSKAHSNATQVKYITAAAQKATVIASVTGTGQVSEENKIDLTPKTAGTITSINVKQGDKVKAGQTIAVIDETNNLISLKQAQAAVASAQASYDKLVAGATADQISLSKLSVTSAQQALDQAKSTYQTTQQQQSLTVSKALSSWFNDNLQAVASGTPSTVTVTVSGNYNGTDKGQYIISLYSTGTGLYYSVEGLAKTSGQVQTNIPLPIGNGLYITFGSTGSLSQNTLWTVDIPNERSTNYLSDQTAYNSALQAQTVALNQAQNAINTAENNLQQAQIQLNQTQSPPTDADLASSQAQLLNAQAQLQNAQQAYSDNIIKSPWDGTVAQLNYTRAGQQATTGTAIATVITDHQVATISLNEVDVAKIKVGQKATLNFDAIDGLQITGEVAQVDTIGTVSQGVVTYNVKIGMDTQDDRVKPGMSVSASIITNVAADVLTVPNGAVKTSGNTSYVQILGSDGKPQNQTVTTGLADDTNTQILSGLNEGQEVVTQTITNAATTSSTSGSATGNRSNASFFGGGAVRVIGGGR
ncbi:MAG: efflux RND transporter periplasmic adaptor subunit [Patescibacteria group bacterium]|nr:efflux RND transporter periplasmic adaptor subunit [Patescibacteria group bacterium]